MCVCVVFVNWLLSTPQRIHLHISFRRSTRVVESPKNTENNKALFTRQCHHYQHNDGDLIVSQTAGTTVSVTVVNFGDNVKCDSTLEKFSDASHCFLLIIGALPVILSSVVKLPNQCKNTVDACYMSPDLLVSLPCFPQPVWTIPKLWQHSDASQLIPRPYLSCGLLPWFFVAFLRLLCLAPACVEPLEVLVKLLVLYS
jgi:hypothetical protein